MKFHPVLVLCAFLLLFQNSSSSDQPEIASIPGKTSAQLYLDSLQVKYPDNPMKWAYMLDSRARDLDLKSLWRSAINHFLLCIKIRKDIFATNRVKDHENLQGIVRAYHNTAYYLTELPLRFEEAESYLDTCLEKIDEFKEYGYYEAYRQGRAHHIMARIYEQTKGYTDAEWSYRQAIPYFNMDTIKTPVELMIYKADVYSDLAVMHNNWELPNKGLEYIQKAIDLYKQAYPVLVQELENEIDSTEKEKIVEPLLYPFISNLSACFSTAGIACEMMDSLDQSTFYYDAEKVLRGIVLSWWDYYTSLTAYQTYLQEKKVLEEVIFSGNLPKKAAQAHERIPPMQKKFTKNYNNLSIVYRKKKAFHIALSNSNQAIRLTDTLIRESSTKADTLSHFTDQARNYHNRAEIYYDSADFQSALVDQEQALSYIIQTYRTSPEIVLDQRVLLEVLAGKAQTQTALGDLNGAQATYQAAIARIDEWRLQYQDRKSQLGISRIVRKIFEGAILLEDCPETAFELSEKSRSYALLNSFRDIVAIRDIDDDRLKKENELRLDIARKRAEFMKTGDIHLLDAIDSLTKVRNTNLDILLENDAYRRAIGDASVLSSNEVRRKLLGRGQALVEYFVGEDTTIIFVIDKNAVYEPVPVVVDRDSLRTWTRKMWEGMNTNPQDSGSLPMQRQYAAFSRLLYTTFIAPIRHLTNAGEWIILPDDGLATIPFEALLTDQPEGDYFSDFPFLIRDKIISYSYSATLLHEMRKNRVSSQRLLAFAPTFNGGQAILRSGKKVENLSYAQEEVREIEPFFLPQNSIVLQDSEATKQNFIRAVYNNAFEFIHLTTHGFAFNDAPESSCVLFYQNNKKEAENILTVREIYDLRIEAENCVLSACETHYGPIQVGEGISSLSRALAYAGVNTIMASLWQVSDEKTKDLMVNYYQNIKHDKRSQAESMQLAKKMMIDRKGTDASPYYWAAFIVIGHSDVPSNGYEIYFALALAIVLVGVYWFFIRRKRAS